MYMYAAMHRWRGYSLTATLSDTYTGAKKKALALGLNMDDYMICRC